MSTVDDLMVLVWNLVRSGPNFDGRDKALRSAIESALRAEYERGRSEREQGAEPVAFRVDWGGAPVGLPRFFGTDDAARMRMFIENYNLGSTVVPLYASPPMPMPKRKTLTDEQIAAIALGTPGGWEGFTRAVERAHGIGDE